MIEQRHRARVRRAHLLADPRLRRVRLPGEPRRQLRADRLRDRVAALPPSRRVRVRAAQRAADGVLRAGDDRRGRQAPRRAGAAGRRAAQRAGTALIERQASALEDGAALREGPRRARAARAGTRRRRRRTAASKTSSRAREWPRAAYSSWREAGALDSSASRPARDAVWAVREVYTPPSPMHSRSGAAPGAAPLLRRAVGAEEVLWDYRSSQHSTRGHPLSGLRGALAARRVPTAAELNAKPDGSAHALRGHGDLPPASRHRHRRHVLHARGRDRLREPGGLAARSSNATRFWRVPRCCSA